MISVTGNIFVRVKFVVQYKNAQLHVNSTNFLIRREHLLDLYCIAGNFGRV